MEKFRVSDLKADHDPAAQKTWARWANPVLGRGKRGRPLYLENRGDPRCMESALCTVPVLSPGIGEWGNWSPEKISAYGFHHRRMQPCKSRGLGTFH